MLTDIFRLIAETVGGLFVSVLLLRAYSQWVRLSPRNPLSQFVMTLTDGVVLRLRRVIPGLGGVDWASLTAAYFVALLAVSLMGGWAVPGLLLVVALVWMLKWALYLVMMLTVAHAVLSWISPYAPVAPTLATLVAPLLAPLQRIIPRIGNVDLTPLVLLLLVQIGLLLLRGI